MDKRIHYYMVLDTETTNTMAQPFVYDIGGVICDRRGRIYETFSYVIRDIFINERELMNSAYYAEKIPDYWRDIWEKKRQLITFQYARDHIINLMKKYHINDVCAYNAHFDVNALNTTQRWITKSRYRYFFPYGINIICIWNMATQILCTRATYASFCERNGLISNHGKNYSTSAETVYKYLLRNPAYIEEHKSYDDSLIESQIMARCFKAKKKFPYGKGIKRNCWMKVKRRL